MRVLLTGASSFTGFWFACMLADAGHEVTAPLLRARDKSTGDVRAKRVLNLEKKVRIVENCAFGSSVFMNLLEGSFDLLAHHAAQVGDYRSSDFNISDAVAANTNNLRAILSSGKIGNVLLTTSIFAQREGVGSAPLKAFSPYGLSKGITTDIFAYRTAEANVPMGRFVIPNPFGPYEEPRFCAYLIRTWKDGKVAAVNTPSYVRDNIHVDLLAKAYLRYAEQIVSGRASAVFNPSGYIETQGVFAQRFAREMKSRIKLGCELNLVEQTEFSEPLVRVNSDHAALYVPDWCESLAWDQVAEAYKQ